MVKAKLILLSLVILLSSCSETGYSWRRVVMDGSRTGTVAVTTDNISQSIGTFSESGDYTSPDGKVFDSSSATARVAAIVRDAQPKMSRVKKVIAVSAEELPTCRGESKLSNWFVDIIMAKAAALSGKKVDVGICNFGGIRVDMPQGEVILDDMLSMFPFRNDVVYLEHKGSELKKMFEKMAATKFEALGGVRIVSSEGKIDQLLIGGVPVDDEKYYGVATISFLLYGGDSLYLAENARNMTIFDVQIIDAVLEHIAGVTARGEMITAPTDVRVTVVK